MKRALAIFGVLFACGLIMGQVGNAPGVTSPPGFAGGAVAGAITGPTGCANPAFSFSGDATAGLCDGGSGTVKIQSLPSGTNRSFIQVYNTGLTLDAEVGSNFETFTMDASGMVGFTNQGLVSFGWGGTPGANFQMNNNGVNVSTATGTRYYAVGVAKALTESSPTAVFQVGVSSVGSGGEVIYTVRADDGTDFQARSGHAFFALVNKLGTETCTISGYDGTANPTELKDSSNLAVSNASTLTYTWGTSNSPGNACNFTLNAISSLNQTTLDIFYTVIKNGANGQVVTPQ